MAVRFEWKPTKIGRRYVRVVERDAPAKASEMAIVPDTPDFIAKVETETAVAAESAPVAVPTTQARRSTSKSGTTRRRSTAKKKSDG